MSKLAIISSKEMCRILRHLNFALIRQKGSHAYYRHPDGRATVVPMHKGEDLSRGMIRAILSDIELAPGDYDRLRSQI